VDAHRAAEQAARSSYGRLVAYLSARSRDLAAAEDALGEAFRAALTTWPRNGVPEKPEAWLFTVARSHLIDRARRATVRADAAPTVQLLAEEIQDTGHDGDIPDDRLKLLFICAHPAIDARVRTPLMLQTVLGLDAARIASAFCVAPATMGQRLVRAKEKIRLAGIAFEVPERAELPARLGAVLEAIYAAYGAGWDDVAGADPRRQGLTEEAIWLARLVVQLAPDEPEARGLLALVLHCEARRAARRGPAGVYVPLSEQDVRLWSRPMIDEAERELTLAAQARTPGRFQLEAAIQSVHAHRAMTRATDWESIALLYEELVHLAAAVGALVGRAAALGDARGPRVGLAALDEIAPSSIATYQPYWAVRAHLLTELGLIDEARVAYARAIGLSEDEQAREFLAERSRRTIAGRDTARNG
jgi:RNA polymerase sigma-70 factor (ECF subfamily)